MTRIRKRAVPLLIAVCMIFSCVPALGASGIITENEQLTISDKAAALENVTVISEDITKRGEYEKHFLCSDGTYMAVTYAEPIHYYDSDSNSWLDTDVSLELNEEAKRYEAASGSFAASLASVYSSSQKTVSMSKNGEHPISWSTEAKQPLLHAEQAVMRKSAIMEAFTLNKQTPAASVLTEREADMTQQSLAGKSAAEADAFSVPNRISVAEYRNVQKAAVSENGITLRYTVSQHKIKEDIIISDRSAVSDYVTTLNIGELTAMQQEDGSVELVTENGEVVYTVGAPYLYDADYDVCYDVEVRVEQYGSECIITYSPDRDWLNSADCQYPVVLDPTITSSEYNSNIVDTYVTQADSLNHSAEGNLVVGIKSGKVNRAYIKIANLPKLPSEVMPISANLTIKHGANTTSGRAMSLYRTNSSWSPTSITYSNQPTSLTSIASCSFNTANVSFNFTQTQIQDLYTRYSNGTNYGFQIKYTSESTTNPDYNMLRSMEYPTASERPIFKVSYGYSLPTNISTNTVYKLRNVYSNKCLDVSGGTDANNTNVIQYTPNTTASQQFKLEASSTGNGYVLRAQVGGKTRVLDIYKTNGRVESGNNVQIYANSDPIAQEWLIIPISNFYYKIVPRSNPSVALTVNGTSNGTSTGKTSTSAGNAFVKDYTDSNTQWWIIERADNGTVIQPGFAPIDDGEYYLNSENSSKYMRNSSGNLLTEFTASPSINQQWKFTYSSGKYLIQPANNLNLYLASSTSTIGTDISLISVTNDIPVNCYWTITNEKNMIKIKSYIGKYLYSEGNSLYLTTGDNNFYWRYAKNTEFRPLSSFIINDMSLISGDVKGVSLQNLYPSNAHFTYYTDFEFSVVSATPYDCIRITNEKLYRLVYNKPGTATIKAKHKPSGKTTNFDVELRKDSIIILPGIMGSTFVAKQNFSIQDDIVNRNFLQGDIIWPPNKDITNALKIDAMIHSLGQNNSGMPLYPQVGIREPKVNTLVDGNDQYGAQNSYKNLYFALYENYSDEYDIILYEYDWRKDPYDTANELNTYIKNNCGRIIFVSHSMGGLVSSQYLAKGTEQRNRVIKHISLGTPYLGAEKIPYVMLTGDAIDLAWYQELAIKDPVKDIAPNLKSMYALLPPEQYFRPYIEYKSNNQSISIVGYSNTMNELNSKCSNWNNLLCNQVQLNQNRLFTSNNQHITSLVDSYYIIGDKINTAQKTKMENGNVFSDAKLSGITPDGDGTVTIHSATIAGTTNSNKTFYTYGVKHEDLAGKSDGNDTNQSKIIAFVKEIINDNALIYTNSTFVNLFNIYKTRQ